jgi:hypothetical protein
VTGRGTKIHSDMCKRSRATLTQFQRCCSRPSLESIDLVNSYRTWHKDKSNAKAVLRFRLAEPLGLGGLCLEDGMMCASRLKSSQRREWNFWSFEDVVIQAASRNSQTAAYLILPFNSSRVSHQPPASTSPHTSTAQRHQKGSISAQQHRA